MSETKDVTKMSKFLFSLKDGSSDKVDKSIAPSTPSIDQRESPESNDVILTDETNAEKSKEEPEKSKEEREKELELLMEHSIQYEKTLDFIESCLLKYLAECQREKMNISYTIENLKIPGSKERKELVLIPKARVTALHKFTCSPYFKTISGYPAPANNDTRNRDGCDWMLATMITPSTHWNNEEKRKLEKSVLTQLLENKQDMLNVNEKKTGKKSYCREIEGALIRSSFKIGSSAQEIKQALYFEVRDEEEEYDWLKISISDLGGSRSAHECRAIWFNYLHPKIKKTEWSDEEDEKLKNAAEKNMYQNWDKIAKDMGTGRSPYQCSIYYHFQLEEISSHMWNKEENMKLQNIIDTISFEELISWRKVSYFFDCLNATEVFQKWAGMFANVKKGKFSREEDIILCFGLKQCGPKWTEIAEYFPDRQNIQLRGRHHVLQGRDLEVPWTSCDDNLLQALTHKYGWGMWSKMSEHFLNRTPQQVRSRSLALIRRKNKVDAGEEARPLLAFPRTTPESRKISDVLQAAVNVLERKRIGTDPEDGDKHVMDQLSEVLKVQKRRGRKQGQIIDCVLNNQFRNFFFMGSEQRGGRGKNTCVKSAVPDMAFDLIAALTVLEAQINLPTDEGNISRDNIMPRMDKDVARYLIQMFEKIGNNGSVIKIVNSGDVKNIYIPIKTVTCASELRTAIGKSINASRNGISFPSTLQNLVGIRTLLLCQQHLREQSKGNSVLQQYNRCNSGSDSNTRSIMPAFSSWPILEKNKNKNLPKSPIISALVIPPSLTSIPTVSSRSCSSSTASTLCLTPIAAGSMFPKANSLTACEVRLITNRSGPITSVGNAKEDDVLSTSNQVETSVCEDTGVSRSDESQSSFHKLSQSASAEVDSLVSSDADSNAIPGGSPCATLNDSNTSSLNEGLSRSLDKDLATSSEACPSNPSSSCHMATPGKKFLFSCATSQSTITSSSTALPSCSDSATKSSCTGETTHTPTPNSNTSPFVAKASFSSDIIASAYVTPEMFNQIQFSHAASLFQKRFRTLFFWPSIFSLSSVPQEMKVTDIHSFPDESEETKQGDSNQEEDEGKIPEKNLKKGKTKGKFKGKKFAQKTNDSNTEPKPEKPKRKYVKSGKYSIGNIVDQEVRMSTRKSGRKII